MRGPGSWLVPLGILALAGLPAPAGAQPVGSEFQINTYTTNQQETFGSNLVAADASGNFVVVWKSTYQDGSIYGIFGQRYDSEGVGLGSEFRVNSFTTNSQSYPSVAAAADGKFVVVWAGQGQDDGSGIFGQRYDHTGKALGSEFRVNSYTQGGQRSPTVASDMSGNFVVAWLSYDGIGTGVSGQRYDSAGVALGHEFQVNSYTTGGQGGASIASDASGNFVVVWHGSGQGDSSGVFGQRYDSAGVAQGDEFQVNSFTTGAQRAVSLASDASGNFVVAWHGNYQDGSFSGILAQRFDSSGTPQGPEFRVNSHTPNVQEYPSAISDASGNFLIVWGSSSGQDGSSYGVFGQRYDSAGAPQGDEFQVNSFTSNGQRDPTVAATGTNQFVVAWMSYDQDGSGYGVFGQRFNFAGDTITVESPNTNVRWRIGSVQRIKWTHNLGLDSTFRIELDRDDDGNYEELIAAAAAADSPTRGHFAWIVTGPPSATARVRVSWTDDLSVSDASDVTFQIRPN